MPARRCSPRPTRTSSRWAPRPRTPGSARRATRGTTVACPAAPRAAARPRSPQARALGARHRHRRLDPPARRAVRHRRPQADLRRRLALRHDRVRLLARPGRSADARRDRRGAAARHMVGARDPRDSTSLRFPGADRAAERTDLAACGSACPLRAERRGHRAGRARGLRGDARARRSSGRASSLRAAARPARALRLLRDRAGRGVVQPRALRRRPLRLPRDGAAT
jgi:hypothetical protein